jgi:protein-disulfide isomerase
VTEARQKAALLMGELAQNRGTSKGNATAPVTIVEFSDFQCPYCKKLAETMNQLSPDERAKVRVVFHHLPLPMHAWARTAAEAAGCAQLQGPEVFWGMHDQLFANQDKLDQESF